MHILAESGQGYTDLEISAQIFPELVISATNITYSEISEQVFTDLESSEKKITTICSGKKHKQEIFLTHFQT